MESEREKQLAALSASLSSGENFRPEFESFVTEVGESAAQVAARSWLASNDPDESRVGLRVLGELALNDKSLWPLVLTEVRRFADDGDSGRRLSAAHALRYAHLPETVAIWLRFAADPHADVRVEAMGHLPMEHERYGPDLDGQIVTALLSGIEDGDARVRDWAALGLGRQLDVDTPEIRDALALHLSDDGADAAGEAAVGLARRGDPRVLPVLRASLAREDVGNLYVEAALELGDTELLPLLERLCENGWKDDEPPNRARLLDDAIERCRNAR